MSHADKKVKIVFVDVDGTLTRPGSRVLEPSVFHYIEKLSTCGILVSLATGNAYCATRTLMYYLGLSAFSVAENGAVIGDLDRYEVLFRDDELKRVTYEVARELSEYIYPSIQNEYRFADFALKIRKVKVGAVNVETIIEMVREAYRRRGIAPRIEYSQVAIHVRRLPFNKWTAAKRILELYNIDPSEAAAVGDSEVDLELLSNVEYSFAVANATDEVKAVAKYVTKESGGKGFCEAARKILEVCGLL